MITWFENQNFKGKYVAAFFGQQAAAPYIIATGQNYLGIGGFDGSDPAPTLSQVKAAVAAGELRFFVPGQERAGIGVQQGEGPSSEIRDWVLSTCALDSSAPQSVYVCK